MRNAKYFIIGEAIGAEEEQYGRPFIGASGQELYRMLEVAKWLPPGTAQRINAALNPHYDERQHRFVLTNPNFLPLERELEHASIYITNVCHERPPGNDIDKFFYTKTESKRLQIPLVNGRYPHRSITDGIHRLTRDLEDIRPTFILALGGTALWALTGAIGITKWRGSILTVGGGPVRADPVKVVPTFHPADILREWTHRSIAIQDMRRALRERDFPEVRKPDYHFIVRPSYAESMEWLTSAASNTSCGIPLVGDIETPHGWRNLPGHIACIGFADSPTTAISIPLMCLDNVEGYWPPDQEVNVVLAIRRLMTTRPMIFHKGIFECQHFTSHWGFMPNWQHDTMVMQHVYLPGLLGGKIDPVTGKVSKRGSSLSLSFISSMYCDYYRFWKDDGRTWNQKEVPDEDGWWYYNCEDCAYTYQNFLKLRENLTKSDLWEQYLFMMRLAAPVINMMLRGIPYDLDMRDRFRKQVNSDIDYLEHWLDTVCGHHLNTGSTPQMRNLFYNDLKVAPIYTGRGASRKLTLDDGALESIGKRSDALFPLCDAVIDKRSLSHFKSNILAARLSEDKRLRSEINLTGTETLRFSSTETAQGTGMNLQNINRMPED